MKRIALAVLALCAVMPSVPGAIALGVLLSNR